MNLRHSVGLAAGALALILVSGTAFAQSAPAAKPAATAPAAAAPTASHLAAARVVVQASGVSRSFDVVVPNVISQLTATLTRTRPELTSDLSAVLDIVRPDFMKMPADMVENAARIYAGAMSEDELKQVGAFFNSAAGKQYVATQPAVLDQLVAAMQGWTQKISEDMVTRIRVEMKKRGKDI